MILKNYKFQINGLAKYGEKGEGKEPGGLWIPVNSPSYQKIAKFFDLCWLVFAFIAPIVGSLILICKKHQTQKLILTIKDNSPAETGPGPRGSGSLMLQQDMTELDTTD